MKLYISRFDFNNDPLDVALRRLLMDVGLPKETQQIDRVMEAFADRYSQCNPGLFISTGVFIRFDFESMFDVGCRSSLHPGILLDYVAHGRFQQVKQEENDQG